MYRKLHTQVCELFVDRLRIPLECLQRIDVPSQMMILRRKLHSRREEHWIFLRMTDKDDDDDADDDHQRTILKTFVVLNVRNHHQC